MKAQSRDEREHDRNWLDEDTWASIPEYLHDHIERCAARHRRAYVGSAENWRAAGHIDTIRVALLAYRSLPAATVRNLPKFDADADRARDHGFAERTATSPALCAQYEAAQTKVARIDAALAALSALVLEQPAIGLGASHEAPGAVPSDELRPEVAPVAPKRALTG